MTLAALLTKRIHCLCWPLLRLLQNGSSLQSTVWQLPQWRSVRSPAEWDTDGHILGGYSQFVRVCPQRHRVQMKSVVLTACIWSHLEECMAWTKLVVHIQMLSVSRGFFLLCNWPPTSSAAVVATAPVHVLKWTSPNTMPACPAGQDAVVSQLTSLSSAGPTDWLSWPLPVRTHLLRTGGH